MCGSLVLKSRNSSGIFTTLSSQPQSLCQCQPVRTYILTKQQQQTLTKSMSSPRNLLVSHPRVSK